MSGGHEKNIHICSRNIVNTRFKQLQFNKIFDDFTYSSHFLLNESISVVDPLLMLSLCTKAHEESAYTVVSVD